MNNNKGAGFEMALKGLKDCTEIIKSKELSLEETIKCYEEGMKHYQDARKIIDEAKQTISVFREENQ